MLKTGQEVILVDHNEALQSVENIENAKIVEVVDHHKINMKTDEPLYYLAKPYGCTSTILFDEFKSKGLNIDKETATLMISAIISDTLLLKSPTCTPRDVEVFQELENIAEVNGNEYGLELLKAGTDISDYTAEQIIDLDAKLFEENGKKLVIDQVNTADIDDVLKRKDEIAAAMEKAVEDKGLSFFMFVVTDIVNTNSKAFVLGPEKEIVAKAFDGKLDSDDCIFLEGVVSRKKQIAPVILKNA